jgi:hypothetical protein
MPLPNASAKGTDVAALANAVNTLAESLGSVITHTYGSGSISVGTLSPDVPLAGQSITEADFQLATGPTGSAAVFDVLVSADGTHFISATGGAGVTIAAGQTSGAIDFRAQGGVPVGSLVRISVLQVGSGTPGAGLTVSIGGSVL